MAVLICTSPSPIQLPLEDRRAPERHHPLGPQGHIVAGGRISTSAGGLATDAEFPKAGEQNILPGFEAGLDVLQDGFNEMSGFHLRKSALAADALGEVIFGQGHGGLLTQGGESGSLLGMCLRVYPPPDGRYQRFQLAHRELHEKAEVVLGGEYLLDGLDELLLVHIRS